MIKNSVKVVRDTRIVIVKAIGSSNKDSVESELSFGWLGRPESHRHVAHVYATLLCALG